MAQRTSVSWDGLSDPVRRIVTWAAAAELGPEVGSPGLMLGMLRSAPDSPPHTLLAHFGVSHGQLFDALQEVAPGMRLDPSAAPAQLHEPPVLTTNAARILERAAEIHRDVHTDDVDAACVFGALLETSLSTAAVALSHALPQVPLPRLRDSYFDWLNATDLSYEQALERDFPRAPRPASKGPASAVRRAPWASVVRLTGPVSDFVGHGFFVRPWLVATEAAVADASTHAIVEGDLVSLVPETHDEQVALLRVAGAFELDEDLIAPLGTATVGSPCEITAFRRGSPERLVLGGQIGVGASGGLVVELGPRRGLEDEVVAGSPVIADGQVVGVVATSRSDTNVAVCDARQLARLLDAAPPPAPSATGTLSGAGNDAVGDVDQLGFAPYVTAFADLIASPHTQPPLTIGIFGSWGSGKSFLLEHIEREIDRRQTAKPDVLPRVHVVRFNAWEYSATEVVWPGLVRKIVTRLDKLTTWPRHKRIRTRLCWNLARQWDALRLQLIAAGLVVGAAVAAALAQGESTLAGAIFGVAAALGASGILKAAKDPIAQWVTALFADSGYGRQLGVMEDIKHDLEQLEGRLHRQDADGNDVVTGRILVLIDDLDRCEPAKAVEVLQAVNLLLNFPSFVVCLGIDARIVTGAIEKHYEGLLGEAGASGYEYLDKIVQIPFRIPEPRRDEIMTFVAGQLGNPQRPPPPPGQEPVADAAAAKAPPSSDDEPARTVPDADVRPRGRDGVHRDGEAAAVVPPVVPAPDAGIPFTYAEQQAFEHLADHLRPNPRHLKRLVNVYRLVRTLARAQDERLIVERPAATIRWLVMWSQWPYASLAIMRRFDAQLEAWNGTIPAGEGDADALPRLLDEVAPTLDRAARDRLDDDADALRALLAISGCGLSWEEIRRIRRYTVNFNPAIEEQVPIRLEPAPAGEAQ